MMNGYDEKRSFGDEPEGGSFVRAFDAFRMYPILIKDLAGPPARSHDRLLIAMLRLNSG